MSSEVTRMSSGTNSSGFQNPSSNTMGQVSEDPNSSSDVKPVSIFSNDYKKHDDLKQMLDSNKENLKLEAMKRIVGMIAKGKNASELFPAVVKNVVSKNVEIKKLVYVYLMRYAEEQQDLALLSISTFQRALKDPNQLIRASALRVLSSIRVPIIVTIMMLAIKEAVTDMSPYVRKTAANAISKLYSLDPELKEDLVGIIEKLLADKTILVAGSAIQAFEEVCPERIDLIHKNYRKLCNLLIDVDEWGQVVIINMLIRYARTQFANPNSELNKEESKVKLNKEENDSENEDEYDFKFNEFDANKKMDPDHRLLLRVTKPLLQSRNSAVVLAVSQLYYYIAPKNEVQIIAKPLVRLLRSHIEVQMLVLKNIVSIAQKKHQMFQQHQKSFYVHSNDSIHVKLLKLEILTCLANEGNISIILREFQAYVLSNDKEFAAATIHAIGRCASSIKEVADNCLTGLVNLMSKKDETIVAESVVVIKRLLQSNPSKNGHIIKKMAKMAEKVTVPMARASILWLIGEYSERVSKIAPDILRKMAKSFCEEENVVKLQVLNLAAKLYITNPKQTTLLVQYVLNLAKYDQNYDIRDRSRYLRTLIFNNEKCPLFAKHFKKVILVQKPAPLLQSMYKDSDQFQLSTLSHAISSRVSGYSELPDFPIEVPDPTVRNIEIPVDVQKSNQRRTDMEPLSSKTHKGLSTKKKVEKFYSDEETDDQSTEGADPTNDEDDSDEDEKEKEKKSESEDDEDEDEDEDNSEQDTENDSELKQKPKNKNKEEEEESESEESSSEEEDEEEEESESSSQEDEKSKKKILSQKQIIKEAPVSKQAKPSQIAKKTIAKSTSESESSKSESESESDHEADKNNSKISSKQPAATKTGSSQLSSTHKEMSLLDLDFSEPALNSNTSLITAANLNSLTQLTSSKVPILSPALAADLANLSSSTSMTFSSQQSYQSKKEYELLNKINGNGLQIQYKFTRTQSANKMVELELNFTNFTSGDFSSFTISNKKLQAGTSMTDLNEFDLSKNAQVTQKLGIDFNDTTQPVQFELNAVYSNDPLLGGTSSTKKWSNLSITCPIGELVQPGWSISENEFNKLQAKLKGMNEVNGIVDNLSHSLFMSKNLNIKLLENFNICQIPSSQQETIKYAALTTSSKTQLLLSLYFANNSNKCHVNVNCEKIVLANMFAKEIKQFLSN